VDLYFSEPVIEGNQLTTSIMLDSRGDRVAAYDLALSFDPKVLAFVKFNPGGAMGEIVFSKSISDAGEGQIDLVAAAYESSEDSGSLADLTFTLKDDDQAVVITVVEDQSRLTSFEKVGNILSDTESLNWLLPE
jgi:hypothetical protein